MKSQKQGDKVFVRLDKGEEVIQKLEKLREKYDIKNGFFHGIGAVNEVKLGNYDAENQEYREKEFQAKFEVTNFAGNIGPDKIHAHITVADDSYQARGGHCDLAKVSGAFEVVIHLSEKPVLKHKYDKVTGLDIFDF